MNKLIILNHKMTLEYDEIFPYINKLNEIETDNNIIVCPSNIYLTDFVNHCTWGVGSQNVSYHENGNYTGEISTVQLKSIGVEYTMIGHYERKKYFHETNEDIHKKLVACLDSNIIPILCFGETGNFTDIKESLEYLLKDIKNIDFIIFAYEPLKVKEKESIQDIEEMINNIYQYLQETYHSKPNIIYGGGIDKKDVKTILELEKLNGLLIGKISSNITKIKKIIE